MYVRNKQRPKIKYSRYQIIDEIGRGGTSVVYRAYDKHTCLQVALKRLHGPESDPANSGEFKSQLLAHEFAVLARLRHPNIIEVFDHGFDDDQQPFLVMEFTVGASTLDREGQGLKWPERVAILLQILSALSYLHRRGILHRDVKPANILVRAQPDGVQAKLLDFGLAAVQSEDRPVGRHVAGSIGYVPPEVQRGAKASADLDLFAVGVLAHELLIGAHPLRERTMFERLLGSWGNSYSHKNDERLSPALTKVLRRAMSQDRRERYADAMEFAAELAQAAGQKVPEETPEVPGLHRQVSQTMNPMPDPTFDCASGST